MFSGEILVFLTSDYISQNSLAVYLKNLAVHFLHKLLDSYNKRMNSIFNISATIFM